MMNSFYIPSLAGQIYAMPGMLTPMHAVMNKTGVYDGFSANYSGSGFSDMKFKYYGMTQPDFDKWVQSVKASGGSLDRAGYLKLAEPTEKEPVQHFASVDPNLFAAAVNACVDLKTMCASDMMRIDAHGGLPLKHEGEAAPTASNGGASNPLPLNNVGPRAPSPATAPSMAGSMPGMVMPAAPKTNGAA